jgi:hypothetical protein
MNAEAGVLLLDYLRIYQNTVRSKNRDVALALSAILFRIDLVKSNNELHSF